MEIYRQHPDNLSNVPGEMLVLALENSPHRNISFALQKTAINSVTCSARTDPGPSVILLTCMKLHQNWFTPLFSTSLLSFKVVCAVSLQGQFHCLFKLTKMCSHHWAELAHMPKLAQRLGRLLRVSLHCHLAHADRLYKTFGMPEKCRQLFLRFLLQEL